MKRSSHFQNFTSKLGFFFLVVGSLGLTGCPDNGNTELASTNGSSAGKSMFITLGTAKPAGAFNPVGNAIATVLNEHKGDQNWKVQAPGTKGSRENIRQLDKGKFQLGMSNSAISYNAVAGTGGWDKQYDIRTVVTIAPNIGLFITKKDSGIKTIGDLKGKRVAVGPSGAGFEMFLGPLLTAHGVTYTDDKQEFTPVNANYSDAVQQLGDGSIDAAFVGGAIPTAAVTQACTSYDVHFVGYDPEAREKLIADFDFFQPANIPAKNRDGKPTYRGMGEEDFPAMNVGSMQLISHENVDEELVYQMTKRIWENRAQVASIHKAGNAINEKNAARFTGTPFHPGAIRFYQEVGIWPESDTSQVDDSTSSPSETNE
ncbi:MAG: TAXI family TRAP transporter solute-binding subunit, partial [Planctomycetota bacterium]